MTDPSKDDTVEVPIMTTLAAEDLISDEHHSRVAAEYARLVHAGEEPGSATLRRAKATVRGRMVEEKMAREGMEP